MKSIINSTNLHNFCYLNDQELQGTPKGLIIEFRGLGGQTMFTTYDKANVYTQAQILYMVPYTNPWNWMNKQAVQEVEEIIAAIKEKYQLETLKIASTGGSMGGLCALTYSAYAQTQPAIVVANCPVCDLEYHFTERPDLPRTLYSAFYDHDDERDFFDVLKEYSPLRLAERHQLPSTRYVIFHCEKDSQVNIHKHSEVLLSVMKNQYSVEFHTVPGRDHCDLDQDAASLYQKVLLDTFK